MPRRPSARERPSARPWPREPPAIPSCSSPREAPERTARSLARERLGESRSAGTHGVRVCRQLGRLCPDAASHSRPCREGQRALRRRVDTRSTAPAAATSAHTHSTATSLILCSGRFGGLRRHRKLHRTDDYSKRTRILRKRASAEATGRGCEMPARLLRKATAPHPRLGLQGRVRRDSAPLCPKFSM